MTWVVNCQQSFDGSSPFYTTLLLNSFRCHHKIRDLYSMWLYPVGITLCHFSSDISFLLSASYRSCAHVCSISSRKVFDMCLVICSPHFAQTTFPDLTWFEWSRKYLSGTTTTTKSFLNSEGVEASITSHLLVMYSFQWQSQNKLGKKQKKHKKSRKQKNINSDMGSSATLLIFKGK